MNKVNDWNFGAGLTAARIIGPVLAQASGAFSVTGIDARNWDGAVGCLVNIGTIAGTETVLNSLRVRGATTATGAYTDVTTVPITVTSTTGTIGVTAVNFQREYPFLGLAGTVVGTTATISLDALFLAMKKQNP